MRFARVHAPIREVAARQIASISACRQGALPPRSCPATPPPPRRARRPSPHAVLVVGHGAAIGKTNMLKQIRGQLRAGGPARASHLRGIVGSLWWSIGVATFNRQTRPIGGRRRRRRPRRRREGLPRWLDKMRQGALLLLCQRHAAAHAAALHAAALGLEQRVFHRSLTTLIKTPWVHPDTMPRIWTQIRCAPSSARSCLVWPSSVTRRR